MTYLVSFGEHFLQLYLATAPYFLVSLLIVGLFHAYFPGDTLLPLFHKKKFLPVVQLSLLLSPTSEKANANALRWQEKDLPPATVASFLAAAPHLGVDGLLISLTLLGAPLTLFSICAAWCSGLFTLQLWNPTTKSKPQHHLGKTHQEASDHHHDHTSSCGEEHHHHTSGCGEEHHHHHTCSCGEEHHHDHTCGCGEEPPHPIAPTLSPLHDPNNEACTCGCGAEPLPPTKTKATFDYGLGAFLDQRGVHLFLGFLLSALCGALIPPDFFQQVGLHKGLFPLLLTALVCLPFSLSAVATVPLALTLLLKGLSPGGVFLVVFLLPITGNRSTAPLQQVLRENFSPFYLLQIGCALCFARIWEQIAPLLPESHLTFPQPSSPFSWLMGGIFGWFFLKCLWNRWNIHRILKKRQQLYR